MGSHHMYMYALWMYCMHACLQKHIQNQNHYNLTFIIWFYCLWLNYVCFLDSSLKDTKSLPFLTHLCLFACAFPNFYVTLNKSMCRMNNVNIFHYSTLLSAKICQQYRSRWYYDCWACFSLTKPWTTDFISTNEQETRHKKSELF